MRRFKTGISCFALAPAHHSSLNPPHSFHYSVPAPSQALSNLRDSPKTDGDKAAPLKSTSATAPQPPLMGPSKPVITAAEIKRAVNEHGAVAAVMRVLRSSGPTDAASPPGQSASSLPTPLQQALHSERSSTSHPALPCVTDSQEHGSCLSQQGIGSMCKASRAAKAGRYSSGREAGGCPLQFSAPHAELEGLQGISVSPLPPSLSLGLRSHVPLTSFIHHSPTTPPRTPRSQSLTQALTFTNPSSPCTLTPAAAARAARASVGFVHLSKLSMGGPGLSPLGRAVSKEPQTPFHYPHWVGADQPSRGGAGWNGAGSNEQGGMGQGGRDREGTQQQQQGGYPLPSQHSLSSPWQRGGCETRGVVPSVLQTSQSPGPALPSASSPRTIPCAPPPAPTSSPCKSPTRLRSPRGSAAPKSSSRPAASSTFVTQASGDSEAQQGSVFNAVQAEITCVVSRGTVVAHQKSPKGKGSPREGVSAAERASLSQPPRGVVDADCALGSQVFSPSLRASSANLSSVLQSYKKRMARCTATPDKSAWGNQ